MFLAVLDNKQSALCTGTDDIVDKGRMLSHELIRMSEHIDTYEFMTNNSFLHSAEDYRNISYLRYAQDILDGQHTYCLRSAQDL